MLIKKYVLFMNNLDQNSLLIYPSPLMVPGVRPAPHITKIALKAMRGEIISIIYCLLPFVDETLQNADESPSRIPEDDCPV